MDKSERQKIESYVDKHGLIFHHPFYLEIVASHWNILTINPSGEKIEGIYTYTSKKDVFGNHIHHEPLLKYEGPWLSKEVIQEKKQSTIDKYLEEMLDQLPYVKSFNQVLHHQIPSPLLYTFRGFNVGLRYTYCLKKDDYDTLYAGYNQNIRRNIKKASKAFEVRSGQSVHSILPLIEFTKKRRNADTFIDVCTLERIAEEAIQRGKADIYTVVNKSEQVVASACILKDHFYFHYLIGGLNHTIPNQGAVALLFDSLLKEAVDLNMTFDFHGSMDRKIGEFFRSFGSSLTPYNTVSKYNSKLLLIKDKLKL